MKGLPQPPSYLSPVGRAKWRELARLMKDANLLESADKELLTMCCLEWEGEVEATEHLEVEGKVIIAGKNNYAMPNPWVAIRDKHRDRRHKMLNDLGLTPVSRSRLPAGKGKGDEDKPKRIHTKTYAIDPRDLLEAKN